jgi:hypothetical protein
MWPETCPKHHHPVVPVHVVGIGVALDGVEDPSVVPDDALRLAR